MYQILNGTKRYKIVRLMNVSLSFNRYYERQVQIYSYRKGKAETDALIWKIQNNSNLYFLVGKEQLQIVYL